jgi:ATP-dependent Clp protease protease subunit
MAVTLPQPKERSLHLAKQVDQASMNELSKAILEINESDEQLIKIYAAYDLEYKPKPIKIYIDSYGGYVYQCLGLLGVMGASKVPVHTIVTGCAMSCGFLIAVSGHRRFAYQKATHLYHQVSSVAWGTVKDMEESLIETKRLQETIEEITLDNTSITKEKLEKVYKRKKDWYITTKEALKLNVIDEVI